MEEQQALGTAAAAYRRYRDVSFFGSLNGVRFLCIIAVMWHHSPAHGAIEDGLRLLRRGFTGVDFFFVLSGFLITTLLLREEARDGRFSLAGFYRRRLLRIVPVYFLVVTAVSAYYVLWKGRDDLAPLVPYYYAFLSNFLVSDIPLLSITWSLAVEEQYYLVWPLLLLLLPIGKARAVTLAFLIAICVASAGGMLAFLGLEPIRTEHALWRLPGSSYAAILIGSLLGVLLHHERGFVWVYRIAGWRYAPVVAFTGLLVVLNETPGNLLGWPNLLVHSTMALCLATVVLREDNILRPVLSWSPVARVGEISYGLYLYHLIGLHFANEAIARLDLSPEIAPLAVTALFVVISVIIAEVSYRTFEAYFLRLKTQKVLPAGATPRT